MQKASCKGIQEYAKQFPLEVFLQWAEKQDQTLLQKEENLSCVCRFFNKIF